MGKKVTKLSSDSITLFDGDYTFGDPDFDILVFQVGGNDTLTGEDFGRYTGIGDAEDMMGVSRGGADVFHGGAGHGNHGAIFEDAADERFIGDALLMSGHATGGRDTFTSGENSSNLMVGDASDAEEHVHCGNDTMTGADGTSGGAPASIPHGIFLSDGPPPFFLASFAATNVMFGDAIEFGNSRKAQASDDTPPPENNVRGGADHINGGDAIGFGDEVLVMNLGIGDAYSMDGASRGGNDRILGGASLASDGAALDYNILLGDGYFMGSDSTGGNDVVRGGNAITFSDDSYAFTFNMMSGDAFQMQDNALAGNDDMTGGDARGPHEGRADTFVINVMAGDTFQIDGSDQMGRDHLTGGSSHGGGAMVMNIMFGDIGSLNLGPFGPPGPGLVPHGAPIDPPTLIHPLFGNDVLVGGSGDVENFMVGDGQFLYPGTTGGDDLLIAGDSGSNTLVGDAIDIEFEARGGNDKLVSGHGNDDMYGDAEETMDGSGGADRFVFAQNNGNDTIHDFRTGDGDKIDLKAFAGIASLQSLTAMVAAGRVEAVDGGVLLHLDPSDPHDSATNTVMLVGVEASDLGRESFAFG